MKYEIFNDDNEVINTIVADIDFLQVYYPGRFRELVEIASNMPKPTPVFTKDELLAQLQALQAQIMALE
jgi:hypothetical protein